VTGKAARGYHTLDSLVSFVDIGDIVTIKSSDQPQFDVFGDFAASFHSDDLKATPDSQNLVVRALWAMARRFDQSPNVSISLEKLLPLGGGIGGGSSDAAAVIWGLLKYWDLPVDMDPLMPLMRDLGADVPVCFQAQSTRMRGIGDVFDAAPNIPEAPIVLAWPGRPCATQDVFMGFDGDFQDIIALPPRFEDFAHMIDFLSQQGNALCDAAICAVPVIENVMAALQAQPGCALARMSGSGSTCFGLFEDESMAHDAAAEMQSSNPDWWVRAGVLRDMQRY